MRPDSSQSAPHIPVLILPLIDAAAPIAGTWIDGTFGAGGYSKYLLDAGADQVIGIDRDPSVFAMAADWAPQFGDRLQLVQDTFSNLDQTADAVDGVVLDIGVSSMQIDQAERGFSFQKDGPLDMRMGDTGPTAADLVNSASAEQIADILYNYGEERASRRIAKMIVARREEAPFERTLELAGVVERCLPRAKPGQSHPATRSFQALRIAVNGEYDQLVQGLAAAERVLRPGGVLAVVTFHSVEDRIVKRFFQARAGTQAGSRYAPLVEEVPAQFTMQSRKAIKASKEELDANPRARSAKLRIGRRTEAPALPGRSTQPWRAATSTAEGLMKNLFLSCLVIGVMGLAFWAYTENYETKGKLDEIAQLNRDISEAHSRLRALKAEWAYLNRPERLLQLVNANFDELKLLQLTADHFARLEQIPYPGPDLGPITEPIEVMNREASP